MKKIYLLLLLCAAAAANAAAQSMLKVRLTDNNRIRVSVDGRYFNKQGTSITVGDLPYGPHKLRVFAYTPAQRGRAYEQVIYSGKVTTYDGMITFFEHDPASGNNNIREEEIKNYQNNYPPAAANGGRPRNTIEDYDTQGTGSRPAYTENVPQSNTTNDNNANYNPPASPAAMGTLTEKETASLKKKTAAKATDTEKMTLLKETLKDQKLTTVDVADMMDWFLFEATKVEFAKWTYNIVVDREYFSDLYNKLTYKTSQDELGAFIASHK